MNFLLAMLACDGAETPDSPATDDSPVDSPVDSNDTGPFGFGISGTAIDLMTSGPAAAGLCVTIADPTDAAQSSDPADLIILGTGLTEEGGAFTVKGIETESAIGLFMIISDCADEGTVRATGTGLSAASYEGLSEGAMIEDATAISISTPFEQALDGSAAAAGYTGDPIATGGAMMGFVRDSSGNPISGATVTGPDTVSALYADTNAADGMFTSEAGVNAATDATAGALFFVPAAPIYSYAAEAEGQTFQSLLFGSVPGMITVTQFVAD